MCARNAWNLPKSKSPIQSLAPHCSLISQYTVILSPTEILVLLNLSIENAGLRRSPCRSLRMQSSLTARRKFTDACISLRGRYPRSITSFEGISSLLYHETFHRSAESFRHKQTVSQGHSEDLFRNVVKTDHVRSSARALHISTGNTRIKPCETEHDVFPFYTNFFCFFVVVSCGISYVACSYNIKVIVSLLLPFYELW